MSGAVQPASSIRCRFGNGRRGVVIHRDAHQFQNGLGQFDALRRGRRRVAVSVIVIDCTTTGAPPPTWTSAFRPRSCGAV
jgi:hypothetical protein